MVAIHLTQPIYNYGRTRNVLQEFGAGLVRSV